MQLSPNTSIYRASNAYVLRTADGRHYELTLSDSEVEELLDALGGGEDAQSQAVSATVTALIDSGHVVTPAGVSSVAVSGHGRIADSLADLLGDSVVRGAAEADLVCHVSDDGVAPGAIGPVDLVCYRDGISQVITPRAVAPADVLGRRRACHIHRDRIPAQYRPVVGGRRLDSPAHPVSVFAADLIAHLIIDELCGRTNESPKRSHYLLTVVDLRSLSVVRRPVFPIPAAPQ